MADYKPFGVEYTPLHKRAKVVDGKAYVCKVGEIAVGKAKAIDLGKFRVAVFNIDGEYLAVKDACPHAEYPLSKGMVDGKAVTCASHNWKFNLKSGECLRGEKGLFIRTFEVILDGDDIWVKVKVS